MNDELVLQESRWCLSYEGKAAFMAAIPFCSFVSFLYCTLYVPLLYFLIIKYYYWSLMFLTTVACAETTVQCASKARAQHVCHVII